MRIAITGSMGSGKSTVAQLIREMGYHVKDADQIAKEHLESDCVKSALLKRYGQRILTCDNTIDKAYLASRIFNYPAEKRQLEDLIYPFVYAELTARSDEKIVFSEVPLLFESNGEHYFDEIWVVVSDEVTMFERLKKNRNYTDEMIQERLQHQMSQHDKILAADVIIENNSDTHNLKKQIETQLERILKQYELKSTGYIFN
ncbi:MAG: dephospho-CoA kinase [Erysipelotrichaceae bacterium]